MNVDESLDQSRRMKTSVDECRRMQTSQKNFFLVLMEASEDVCSLICRKFLPQKHRLMKKFFYIVIDAL